MSYQTIIPIILAVTNSIVYYQLAQSIEDSLVFIASMVGVLAMILFSDIIAEYGLGFGFMESLAKDAKTPQSSAPAIAFLGWVALIVTSYYVIF